MYMPKLLKTVYLEEKQFLQQILVLGRLLELPIDFETISDEFHQARISRDLDAQLLKLRMSSEGGHVSYLYEREVKKQLRKEIWLPCRLYSLKHQFGADRHFSRQSRRTAQR